MSNSWPWNPGVLLFLVLLCLLYVLGLRSAARRSPEQPVKAYRVFAFFLAILIIAVLLLTPIDTIARTQLFSVHMVQAVVLTTLCAPLVLFSCPQVLLQPLVALPVVGGSIRTFTRPLVASITFNLVFLLWHVPGIFHLALLNGTLYHVEMLSIFVVALLNWFPLIGSVRELRPMSYPIQMLYAFFDGQPVDILAFVLVFTGVVIYPYYPILVQPGLPAFSDQAVGGALLLIPGLVDLVVMTPLFFRWLGEIENKTKLGDQLREEEAEEEEDELFKFFSEAEKFE